MKRLYLFLTILFFELAASAQVFTLKSKELGGQASVKQVLNGFGCNGGNASPQLYWENPPTGTKSFALTVYDEDAPTGSGWWHWLIFDVPPDVNELKSGAGNVNLMLAPVGSIQSITDFKTFGYGGPCPPEGSKPHRYVVTLYALSINKLGLDSLANPALVGFLLHKNMIARTSLIFYYGR